MLYLSSAQNSMLKFTPQKAKHKQHIHILYQLEILLYCN